LNIQTSNEYADMKMEKWKKRYEYLIMKKKAIMGILSWERCGISFYQFVGSPKANLIIASMFLLLKELLT
jgi:hypothetical protein